MSENYDMGARVGAAGLAFDPKNRVFQEGAFDVQGDFSFGFTKPIDKNKHYVGAGLGLNYLRSVGQQDTFSQASLLLRLPVVKGYAELWGGVSSYWFTSASANSTGQQLGGVVGLVLRSGWLQNKKSFPYLPEFYLDPARFLLSASLTVWQPTAGLQWFLE